MSNPSVANKCTPFFTVLQLQIGIFLSGTGKTYRYLILGPYFNKVPFEEI